MIQDWMQEIIKFAEVEHHKGESRLVSLQAESDSIHSELKTAQMRMSDTFAVQMISIPMPMAGVFN